MIDSIIEITYTFLAILPAIISFVLLREISRDLKNLPSANGGKEFLIHEKSQEFWRFIGQLMLISPGVLSLFLPPNPNKPVYSLFVTILTYLFGLLPFFAVQLVLLKNTLSAKAFRRRMINKALELLKEQNARETEQNVREAEQNVREVVQNVREADQKEGGS